MFLKRLLRAIPEFKQAQISGLSTFFFSKEKSFQLKWRNKHALHLRNRKEDKDIFRQIFIKEQYKVEKLIPFEVNTIIDAGAFTGLSARYLNYQFPKASIFCIEPDIDNFQILIKNTENIANLERFNGVLADTDEAYAKKDPNAFAYGFMFEKAKTDETNTSKGINIPLILKRQKWNSIDLLKMDIEGAEAFVFNANTDWLKMVNCLIIELHDYKLPFSSNGFFKAISKYKYNFYLKGENLIFVFNHE